ncbi:MULTISPECIES: 2,4'-dihydroxyacetophenone dioxygenase family protein [unclassified Caballeronia]|uniref:2,4'-dihydroxyacetophenone dioxygenase family protein n=1 Tax=unclassified Caballeronia TaxID=2646786 RepID=UPI002027F8F0|nr:MULTISPECIES: 2,4'-dihydroxyacetophenone dioxygenase family protein [unclassified Caballeronia]MDR5761438.1 2,4'-dihydroxyacetophenone dioxygenase family protein [Caballeronia sp. LZ035]MDR5769850.1 2,4'-dihydroxyacetophenone dioxygenase family protein [Caballeronia sp. LZ028]
MNRNNGLPEPAAFKYPREFHDAQGLVLPAAISGAEDDDHLWVPQSEGVSFKPIMLHATQGYFINLLRVRRSGVLSVHHHTGPVHAFPIKGRWYYLEHDWVAEAGGYAFEPPGEIHTLFVPEDVKEMITLFHATGGYVYLDEKGKAIGYEDVFTKIESCRAHYERIGLGADYVNRFVR